MMMSSNGNIFRVTGPLWVSGGFPSQRPVTRSFDVFFDVRLNKRLSTQSKCWWFETPWHSLWRYCNVIFKCALVRWGACFASLLCLRMTNVLTKKESRWIIVQFIQWYVFFPTFICLASNNYRQVSKISRTLVGNEIVDHSDVVGASPVGAAPTTSSST